ncbi:MAG: hypothetical protein Unbinned6224contig1001_3 [Prokaryotic dsDNA virus sp.]|nr:MAG: hypothetical protein Unbinned6224contig1001_3 [Prokaryotic dsDNA virus sp.]|tara:strand:- start:7971 stop:8321 length:351 start_codon:yes stop_codon:yes gene_type:complete
MKQKPKVDYKVFGEKQKAYKKANKTDPRKFMFVSCWRQDDGSMNIKLNTVIPNDNPNNEKDEYKTLFEGKFWENQDRSHEAQPSHTGNMFNAKEMNKLKQESLEGSSSQEDDDFPF